MTFLLSKYLSRFYRAQRDSDSLSVILNVLTSPHPSPEELERFTQDYAFTHDVELPGAVKALSLENQQEQWFMVLEEFEGVPLSRLNLAGPVMLPQFLELAIALIELIDQFHQHQIICNTFHPDTILVKLPALTTNVQEKNQAAIYECQIKLIDVCHASNLPERSAWSTDPEVWDNLLPYLSPEHTGRMNREVDHRADFYTLGVILYELLTGQRPFVATDALALVHAHLAKMPVPPCEFSPSDPSRLIKVGFSSLLPERERQFPSWEGERVGKKSSGKHEVPEPTPIPSQEGNSAAPPQGRPSFKVSPKGGVAHSPLKGGQKGGIPTILSDIIMKLLAKNPEDRYQAAYGLKADLQRCLSLLKEEGRIDDFPLGQQDVPDHLHLPRKLYGRE